MTYEEPGHSDMTSASPQVFITLNIAAKLFYR